MSTEETFVRPSERDPIWLPALAIVIALVGMVDSIYLTVHHYTAEPVPCSLTNGCEMVLTSSYSQIAGIPLALFGAAAYFAAFSLALLAMFGDRRMWKLFGVQATIMALFAGWLIYVQAVLIGFFCQFCLLSAGSSVALFAIYLTSVLLSRRSS